MGSASRVWFTISHGIINEIYYPRVDKACTRDLGMIVTDDHGFFSEEKRHSRSQVTCLASGVPAYHLRNTCMEGRYVIEKSVVCDPSRDVLLQQVRFTPLKGSIADYRLYLLLAPHLGNVGSNNTAWVGTYKGLPMLMAERDGQGLALACSVPWRKRSAGFVGFSDGWQDLNLHRRMNWEYARAENGNVALAGEIDIQRDSEFVLALGFGTNASEAAQRARASLIEGFEAARIVYVGDWEQWLKSLPGLDLAPPAKLYSTSMVVLRVHEAKALPGGIIASLSIPWGFSKGDDDLGGYHLVWPRDLVESAGALLAAGAREDALRVLRYLESTQEDDGHWSQNMWLDGTPYWKGLQMDETAFPVLLVDLLNREGALEEAALAAIWPMVRSAVAFLARNGPVTQQDRWEEDAGYSPFTLATEISALLIAAQLADVHGEPATARYLREIADAWNDSVESWTYVTETSLAAHCGVEGYYVRITPPATSDSASPMTGFVAIKNRPPDQCSEPTSSTISTEFLALVRLGLRSAQDPRVLNTLKVIDTFLKVEAPQGPLWHRYNGDGYGEHEDGSAFDGTGSGRLWPLLTGERAHYELSAGRPSEAERLRQTLEQSAGDGGMLPEQVWDTADIPEKELWFGRASGSARPLVWAHAEYIKLVRSLRNGRVFDQPQATVERYIQQKHPSAFAIWRFNNRCRQIAAGKILRIEGLAPFRVHWSYNAWANCFDLNSSDTGLGVYIADLPTQSLAAGTSISFTFQWIESGQWEGTDFAVQLA
jgi:glucoamylase